MKAQGMLVCLCPFLKKAVSFPADISYLLVEEHLESASPKTLHTHVFLHCFILQPGDAETCTGAPANTQDMHTNSHTQEHTHISPPLFLDITLAVSANSLL